MTHAVPGSYPAAFAVSAEERDALLADGVFDATHYAAQVGLPEGEDLLRHYLEVGWRWNLEPRPGFESAFLAPYYAAAGLEGPPLLSWVELGARCGRTPSTLAEAEWRAERLRPSPMFDAEAYSRRLPEGVDPVLHYIVAGEAMGWRPSDRFDPAFYAERHPDVAAIGMSPLLHYVLSGEQEQRAARAVAESLAFPPITPRDGRRAVLVLAHEASRTGAPLLGWRLAAELRARHDVVAVLLRGGALEADFRATCAAVIGPMRWEDWHHAEMARVAERLVAEYDPLYAIANSIETTLLIPALAMHGVPSVALVHEFAAYTRPLGKLTNAFDWAPEIIFPAGIVQSSSVKAFPHLARRRGVHVFPQGRVDLPPASAAAAKPKDAERVRPADAEKAFIVLGAGSVEIRKGVDVFLAVAAATIRAEPARDIRFVWIGHGYDPLKDVNYSAYLAEQMERSGLQQRVRFLGPVADLDPAYAAADVFLLSSRLDPQPNVAIDALTRGLPVVCFEGASGTAEVLAADLETASLVAPHLDAAGAAAIIARLATDPASQAAMRRAVARVAARVFDMAAYVDRVDALGRAASARLVPADLVTLRGAGLDIDMVMPPGETAPGLDGLARTVQIQWATSGASPDQAPNAYFRRGEAGFHPQAYGAAHPAACLEGHATPLAHWIRAGRPQGTWSHAVLPPLPGRAATALRVALHAHMHYPDLAGDLRRRLETNGTRPHLFLTTGSETGAETLLAAFQGWDGPLEVLVMPNRGRDIGPFMHLLPRLAAFDVAGHVHAKRSLSTDAGMGDRWRDFLWANLVGPTPMLDTAAAAFANDPALGLLWPADPHLVGWDGNRNIAGDLAARMGIAGPLPAFFDFPLGTMFWARPTALRPLLRLGLGWDDYPEEPLPDDGTVLHALERLLPFAARHGGFGSAMLRVPATSW